MSNLWRGGSKPANPPAAILSALPIAALKLRREGKAKPRRRGSRDLDASPAQMAARISLGKWKRATHLDLLCERVLATVEGTAPPRLIVSMPPRHGKSEFISHYFPVWYLNQFPERRIILASYEADFASSWGRKVRNTIADNFHQLDVVVSKDSSAANRWDTTEGGGMVTAGVGGPITGRGADLLIIDDPVKNSEEANSPTIRQKVWEWWTSTAYTRLEPGGVVIIVMTRWHPEDLAGKLLLEEQQGGEHWEELKLPALAEIGDPLGRPLGTSLWSDRYDVGALEKIKKAVGTYVWDALYQQNPKSPSGRFFRRSWFEVVEAVPADCQKVRFWDLAATEARVGADPDWTSGGLLGLKDGIVYIIDMAHTRSSPRGVEALIKQTATLDGKSVRIWMEQEPGASGVNTIDYYTRKVLMGYTFKGNRATGGKSDRAAPLASYAEAGNVKLLKGPWNKAFLDEVETFPEGDHDDQVDAASGAFEKLIQGGVYFA